MRFKKVTAIIRCEALEEVELKLKDIGVSGISVTYVKGYGDYANFFKTPPLVKHAHIEIFTVESKVSNITKAIFENAHSGLSCDGIIDVLPVERLYSIRTKAEIRLQG